MLKLLKNRYSILGYLAIILAALLWSIDGLFIRPSFYTLPAALVVFWEHFLGFIVLSPFILLNWKKIKKLSRKNWGAVIWVSLFGGAIGTIMITKAFFSAMDGETTFATVVVLQKLQPIFALFLARIILKEKLPKNFYFWAIIAIVASYVLAFASYGFDIFSVDLFKSAAILAILAAFAFGSSTVFGKRIANHLNFKALSALRFAITTFIVLVYLLFTNGLSASIGIGVEQWQLLALIVFTSGAGAIFLFYFGLRRVSASTTTILELFWPFSALILDYIFNNNYLSTIEIIAVLVLLVSFFKVSNLDKNKVRFTANIIKGEGRGRKIGYPTANLDKTDLDIPHGVYVVKVKLDKKIYDAVMHFGYKEVFKGPVSLEILIKDFSQDIYNQKVTVKVIKKIRDVKKFNDIEDLKRNIFKDLQYIE
ncbi:EamA family transporter [Patescibacteria group bacterium]|nr:EamA family transporter [Patescibacteria group bacterium]